jgi:glycosyltransferase involved in cell wall biosynthesis
MKRISSIRKSLPITKLPNIYLIHGDLSDAEMNELYNHPKIKSMVSATKGEGFGRPLLEFALTGKPIIATGWSGHVDFLNPKLTALMGGELSDLHPSSIQKDILIEGSQWFDVNHGHLGHYLTDVKKNYKEWLPKSKTLSRNLRKNFSYSAMKNLLGSILNENVKIPTKMELKLPKLKKLTPINK